MKATRTNDGGCLGPMGVFAAMAAGLFATAPASNPGELAAKGAAVGLLCWMALVIAIWLARR